MQVNSVLNTNKSSDLNTLNHTSEENNNSFSSVLENQTKETTLEDIFKKASELYGVSVSLLQAVAKQESNFDPKATSRCGAQGIMQLMPATAAGLGVTDAYDPEQNIMGGAKYLSQLLSKYDGDTTLALAAYNAGSNNVAKYGGVPPFKETQNYVVKVTEYMQNGVTLPDGTVTTGSSSLTASNETDVSTIATTPVVLEIEEDGSNLSEIMDSLFSYDDYLKFLDIYLESFLAAASNFSVSDEDEEQAQETSNYYAYQNMRYNPAIINLFDKSEQI